jgi:hypothetical protein
MYLPGQLVSLDTCCMLRPGSYSSCTHQGAAGSVQSKPRGSDSTVIFIYTQETSSCRDQARRYVLSSGFFVDLQKSPQKLPVRTHPVSERISLAILFAPGQCAPRASCQPQRRLRRNLVDATSRPSPSFHFCTCAAWCPPDNYSHPDISHRRRLPVTSITHRNRPFDHEPITTVALVCSDTSACLSKK